MQSCIFRKSLRLLISLFILFFAFAGVAHLLAGEEDEGGDSGVKYFKSPNSISSASPLMVVFRHEDEPHSVAHGHYGETAAKSIFRKYAVTPGVDVDYFEPNNAKGNGYDFVMVDHAKKIVMILEAKST